MSDSGAAFVLDVEVGQHLDTSEVKVDIQPFFARLLIKVCKHLSVLHPSHLQAVALLQTVEPDRELSYCRIWYRLSLTY